MIVNDHHNWDADESRVDTYNNFELDFLGYDINTIQKHTQPKCNVGFVGEPPPDLLDILGSPVAVGRVDFDHSMPYLDKPHDAFLDP